MSTVKTDPRHRSPTGTPRWRQFAAALACRPDPRVDARIRVLLDDDRQWALVARLPAYDRRHALHVHDRLRAAGHVDPDLLRAALLHDVGKADARARVGVTHRVLRVILRWLHPSLPRRLATRHALSYRLFLAEHHAALGAEAAQHAGASERCCQLIARHELRIEDVDDRELRALIAADEGAELP